MNIPYAKHDISEKDIQAVVDVLRGGALTQGPLVDRFENDFSKFIGCNHSIAVTNGTAALHLAILALNIKSGDKVLCTPMSFVASSNCVLYCGGEVEFVDIDPKTQCLDLNKLQQKLDESPKNQYKGVIAVDMAGHPMNFEKLSAIAKKHNMWVLEDACHAPGAEFKDSRGEWQKSGNGKYADVSVFSFHPAKHVAMGEGGIVTTNDSDLAKKIKLLRTHGITKNPSDMEHVEGPWYYEMQTLGFNYRVSDILCALGISQLSNIQEVLKRRREIAQYYNKHLAGLPITLPFESSDAKHAYHLYVIQSEKRLELFNFLKTKNIIPQVHYIPIHKQPYYQDRYGKQSFPMSESYYNMAMSLPMYPALTNSNLEYVVECIHEFYRR